MTRIEHDADSNQDTQQHTLRARLMMESAAMAPEDLAPKIFKVTNKDQQMTVTGFRHGPLCAQFEDQRPQTSLMNLALMGKGILNQFKNSFERDHGRKFLAPLTFTLGFDVSGRRFFSGIAAPVVRPSPDSEYHNSSRPVHPTRMLSKEKVQIERKKEGFMRLMEETRKLGFKKKQEPSKVRDVSNTDLDDSYEDFIAEEILVTR